MVRGKQARARRVSDRERVLRSRIKMGRNIALIGFFCPIFWVSLFAGMNRSVVMINAVHSGAVILIGLAVMGVGAWALANHRADEKQREMGNCACESPTGD